MNDRALASRTLAGTLAVVAARALTRALDLSALIILARLLTPADFGLVAIASSLILVAEAVFELPLTSILSREAELQPAHLDTSFTITLIKGLALGLVGALLAAAAAVGYHDIRLAAITLCLSISPILRGMQSPGLILRFREVQFGQTSLIEIVGKVFGLTAAVLVAYYYHSYWALVANVVLTPAVMIAASYWAVPYRPRLTLSEWKTFSSTLKWNSASQIVTAANWQCDRVILAAFVPQSEIGRYSLASTMAAFPEQAAVKPTGGPILAALARVALDPSRLASVYLQSSRGVFALGAPLFILLSVLGPSFCLVVLGAGKWAGAAPLLTWLALTPLLALPYSPLAGLAIVTGNSKTFATRSLYEFAVQIPLTIILIYFFAVQGAVFARFLTSSYMLVVSLLLTKKIGGIDIVRQLSCLRDPAIGLVGMLALLYLELPLLHAGEPPLARTIELVAAASSAVLAYFAVYLLSWACFGRSEGVETHAAAFVKRLGLLAIGEVRQSDDRGGRG